MAAEFDLQLESDGMHKSMSLYKEPHFTKLGYYAAAILDCKAQFDKLLANTSQSNLLVQACNIHLQSEYVCAALKALGYFTYYKVTMPFLNCVERCNQNTLLPILKQLYIDLSNGNMETLKDYIVPWKHINIDILKPMSPLDNILLQKMCTEAAAGIHMQCSAEY